MKRGVLVITELLPSLVRSKNNMNARMGKHLRRIIAPYGFHV
jgi:hypothetical protein